MIHESSIRCLLVEEIDSQPRITLRQLAREQFTDGNVTIEVAYSSLNFKDSLACQGHRGVVRNLPHVPGIDLAGTVIQSASPEIQVGERVLVTGYDLGQGHWGGWSELACVPADWIVKLPQGLNLYESMFIGTAGFTAAQCLFALQRNGVQPNDGPIVVTGATGGVGSIAVRLLAQCGYEVVAVTGKADCADALKQLGASRILSRDQITSGDASRPLLSAQWAGAVDTVGGPILTALLKSTKYGGCVTACGLVAGHQLEMTVYPFLLRGVSLCGVASADCPMPQRLDLWKRLASDWKPGKMDLLHHESSLEQLPQFIAQMSRGELAGRVVVRCSP